MSDLTDFHIYSNLRCQFVLFAITERLILAVPQICVSMLEWAEKKPPNIMVEPS